MPHVDLDKDVHVVTNAGVSCSLDDPNPVGESFLPFPRSAPRGECTSTIPLGG